MALELMKVVKDKKVYPVLLKWSTARHSDEQVGFIADTSNNEKLYTKWVSPASPKQVNLKGPIQLPLEDLAKAKKWKAMDSLMKQAKEFVADAFDRDEMVAFEKSPQYLALTPAPAPAKPVAPPRPVTPAPAANPVAIATAKSITQMNTDMSTPATTAGTIQAKTLSPAIAALAFHRPWRHIAVSIKPAPSPLRGGTSGRPMNQISPAPKTPLNIQCDGIDASVRATIVPQAAPMSPNELAAPIHA